jgi:hypothetical protein
MTGTLAMRKPGHYARQICQYLKRQPGGFVDDPEDVRAALNLSEKEFKLIVLEAKSNVSTGPFGGDDVEEAELSGTSSKLSSMLRGGLLTPMLQGEEVA